ncbi:potassium channel family protein [Rhizobium calliandrae]|uniref:Potassium channel family protein n=1 Tax=Rhizobium calliandrae TaxID=1312182 RepID=A0ABT7KDC4_9HYPH|nr:potassium channel family protein [Rhizobium calliandrae]MDL2405963.1 potassium channel family protein [Rhizobium calliandrae]
MVLAQFLLAGIVSLGNIAIHAIIMAPLMVTVDRALRWRHQRPEVWLAVVMTVTVSVLMIAHAVEVTLWAATYATFDIAPPGADVLYFAFVNYTTLGYGDVLPREGWRLLGPITAMNGVLLFGWSAAVIFEVLTRAMQQRDEAK